MIILRSESDGKVLFFPEFFPEEHQPDEKQVDTEFNPFIIPDLFPGILHLPAPVDVVENDA
jgi:hypothetical protein